MYHYGYLCPSDASKTKTIFFCFFILYFSVFSIPFYYFLCINFFERPDSPSKPNPFTFLKFTLYILLYIIMKKNSKKHKYYKLLYIKKKCLKLKKKQC